MCYSKTISKSSFAPLHLEKEGGREQWRLYMQAHGSVDLTLQSDLINKHYYNINNDHVLVIFNGSFLSLQPTTVFTQQWFSMV